MKRITHVDNIFLWCCISKLSNEVLCYVPIIVHMHKIIVIPTIVGYRVCTLYWFVVVKKEIHSGVTKECRFHRKKNQASIVSPIKTMNEIGDMLLCLSYTTTTSSVPWRHITFAYIYTFIAKLKTLPIYSATDLLPWVNCKNSTSLAYLTLSGKYSERNFLLKTSQVTGSCLSSMMDFILIHQCSASPVSMYTVKANLLSSGHILASKILSMSFNH